MQATPQMAEAFHFDLPGTLLPRITTLILTALTVFLSTGPAKCGDIPKKPSAPNIVLILVDDLGWADLPCYGNRFHETPRIDQLAREGMRFTDFYAASPVCSSTRASIQSGQYPARVGITNFIPGHFRPYEELLEAPILHALPPQIVTPAESLGAAGYATAHFGKWHLGGGKHGPQQQGYDVSISRRGPAELTDAVLEFIEARADEPFFVDLSHHWVHIPLRGGKELTEKYRRKPKPAGGVNNPSYAAMVEEVDRSTGRVLDKLDALKLADSTLVIFTSDNGGLSQRFDGRGEVVTTNAPLRDEKGSLYEGGIRVPLLVRWPGVVPPGSTYSEPALTIDFYPTLLEAAGAAAPKDQVLDGLSLLPLWKSSAGLEREAIYFHYPHYHHSRPSGAVRQGPWKLIEFYDDRSLELYRLDEDLGETRNLCGQMPEKAEELRRKLAAWRKSVGAKMPSPNPDHDPARADQWGRRR